MEHFPLDAGESELARGSRSGQGPHEARLRASRASLFLPCAFFFIVQPCECRKCRSVRYRKWFLVFKSCLTLYNRISH